MENKSLKIGILGLGLIGGSILKVLSLKKKFHLSVCSESSYEKARQYADCSSADIEVLKDCDLVFVCSKMSRAKEDLKRLEKILSKDAVVADVCSIKGFLADEYSFKYIPSHPMAGTEFFGFENSFETLFAGAKWIVGEENETLEDVIKEMGATPVILDSKTHDEYAAQISHLPMLVSYALFEGAEDGAKKIAASGFRDTTRLAMTNADMAYDMLNLNRENILLAYERFVSVFEKMKAMDEDEFKKFVYEVAKKRSKMYDENGKNIH